jgi:hypothetical protein
MSLFNAQLTAAGFVKTSLASIVAKMNTLWQGAWGADVDVDPRSADGNIIGALAEMFDDLNGIAADTVNLANPNGATGTMLANLAYLTGITKNGESYPSAPCVFLGTAGTAVPYTFTVKSTDDGTSWMPPQSPLHQYTIGEPVGYAAYNSGTAYTPGTFVTESSVSYVCTAAVTGGEGPAFDHAHWSAAVAGSLICTTIGPLVSGGPPRAGVLTQILTVTSGIASVTNTVGIPGAIAEADPNLRVRRQQATGIAAQGMTDGLQAALKALKNPDGSAAVLDAVVWENNLNVPYLVGANSINANTVYCIVEVVSGESADPTTTGTDDDPIANTIFALKGNGCNTQGPVSKYPLDKVGNSHLIQYARAYPMSVLIRINISPRLNFPTDGATQIKQAISNWASGSNTTTGRPNIPISGDDKGTLSWTDVLSAFVAVVPGFDFLNMEFSGDGGSTWTTSPNSLAVPFGSFVAISTITVNGT